MTNDVKALIAEAREWVDWNQGISLSQNQNVASILERLTAALEAATSTPAVDREALASVLEKFIEGLRAERRLYPDLYRLELADALIASGILRDVRDVQAEALEQAAAHVEKLRAVEESVPAESATQSAMRSHLITEFEVLRDHFIECAQALREARSER